MTELDPTPTDDLISMSPEEQFRLHHSTLYPAGSYPEGTLLPMMQIDYTRADKGLGKIVFPAWDDLDAQWDFTRTVTERGSAVYRTMAGMRGDMQRRTDAGGARRGDLGDVLHLTSIYADLDTTSGSHAQKKLLPVMSHADGLAILLDYPLPVSILLDSGGGWQSAWCLDEPLDPSTPEGADLLARHKRHLGELHAAAGVEYDPSVAGDPARILRVPGGVNAKPVPVVGSKPAWTPERVALIRTDLPTRPITLATCRPEIGYTLDQLDAALPQLPAKKAATRTVIEGAALPRDKSATATTGGGTATGVTEGYVHQCGSLDHEPADSICARLPISRLMRELPGIYCPEDPSADDRGYICWADAESIEDDVEQPLTWAHEDGAMYARLYYSAAETTGEMVSTLTAFGAGTAGALGVETSSRTCTWALLRYSILDDGPAAHRLVADYTTDEIVTMLAAYPVAADLLEAYPSLTERRGRRSEAAPAAPAPVREIDMLDMSDSIGHMLTALGWVADVGANGVSVDGLWVHPDTEGRTATTVTEDGVTTVQFNYKRDQVPLWGAKPLNMDDALKLLAGGKAPGAVALDRWMRDFDPSTGVIHRTLVACEGDPTRYRALALRHRDDASKAVAAVTVSDDDLSRTAPLAVSLAEAVETMSGTRIELADNLVAVIGGPRHGLYTTYTDYGLNDQPVTKTVQVTNWIAWRSKSSAEFKSPDQQSKDATFSVTLIRKDFRRFVLSDLSDEASMSPRTIRMKMGAGVSFPWSQSDLALLTDMLDILGMDERSNEIIRRHTGWVNLGTDEEPNHVFIGVIGSVDSVGIRPDVLASLPSGMQSVDCQLAGTIGWTAVPQNRAEMREAAKAIKSFINIVPDHPEIAIGILGIIFAAPMMANSRALLDLVCDTDSGKSLMISAAQTFWSTTPLDARLLLVDVEGSTSFGAIQWMSWCRGLAITLDDFRMSGDPRHNERVKETIAAASQVAYGKTSAAKGTKDGGLRATASIVSPILLSSECTHEDPAVTNRQVILRIAKGDIPIHPMGSANIDVFSRDYGQTGLASKLFAAFLSHYAGRLDEKGLGSLSAWASQKSKEHFARYATQGGRSNETIGYARMGWDVLYRLFRELGCSDLLPDGMAVDNALLNIGRTGREIAEAANYGTRLVDGIGDAIRGNMMHLASSTNGRPSNPEESGWSLGNAGPDGEARYNSVGAKAGYWTHDMQKIVIVPAGVSAFLRNNPALAAITGDQRTRALNAKCDLALSGKENGGEGKISTTIDCPRVRGWVFDRQVLGFFTKGDDKVLAADITPEAAAKAAADKVRPVKITYGLAHPEMMSFLSDGATAAAEPEASTGSDEGSGSQDPDQTVGVDTGNTQNDDDDSGDDFAADDFA